MDEPSYSCTIVDDDQLILLELEVFIEQIPWLHLKGKYSNPIKAATGIFEERPDIIILDIEMPYANGFELLDWISPKLDLINPRPHVVIISASPERPEECYSHPVLCRIYKPDLTNPTVLAEKIKESLDKLSAASNPN